MSRSAYSMNSWASRWFFSFCKADARKSVQHRLVVFCSEIDTHQGHVESGALEALARLADASARNRRVLSRRGHVLGHRYNRDLFRDAFSRRLSAPKCTKKNKHRDYPEQDQGDRPKDTSHRRICLLGCRFAWQVLGLLRPLDSRCVIALVKALVGL